MMPASMEELAKLQKHFNERKGLGFPFFIMILALFFKNGIEEVFIFYNGVFACVDRLDNGAFEVFCLCSFPVDVSEEKLLQKARDIVEIRTNEGNYLKEGIIIYSIK